MLGAGEQMGGRARQAVLNVFPTDPGGLADKLNKSRPLGAEDLWLIEQDLNQQLQAGAVAESLSLYPITNPLNLDSAGGYQALSN